MTPDKKQMERYRENLQGEVDGAYLYRSMAKAEKKEGLASVYSRIADAEDRHAAFWKERIEELDGEIPALHPSWRSRAMSLFARWFGPQFVLPTVARMESSDSTGYNQQPESKGTQLPLDEKSHRRLIQSILETTPQGIEGQEIAQLEGRHRAVGGNALRAAVLGANDGLLSNLSLIMGVAGANMSNHAVLITGVAGLLAGAISMALGEWVSVQSSRELYSHQIKIEEAELHANPKEEEEELALIYQAKGLSEKQAKSLASNLMSRKDTALDTLAREEIGVDPQDLGGSAWTAALASFFLFSLGALFPIAPFVFMSGRAAVAGSILLSSAGLFTIGSLITLMTGRSVFVSGFRQLFFGLIAAAVTFGIGRLMGVTLGG